MSNDGHGIDWIGRVSGHGKELADLAKRDLERRRKEGASKHFVILNPNDVSGEYDAGRLLKTTISGERRQLTHSDLEAFRKNIKAVGKRFKSGGIRANQVIDLSSDIDRKRANQEIRHAFPRVAKRGEIGFTTSASNKHGARRHFVTIDFVDFDSLLVDANIEPAKAAKKMMGGRLRFDCDCGRHTFWYRYLATLGGYNAGRAETGFPKERNPELSGCACKHVLRVMERIQSHAPEFVEFIAQAFIRTRTSDSGKSTQKQTTEKAADIVREQKKSGVVNDVSPSLKRKISESLAKAISSSEKPKHKAKGGEDAARPMLSAVKDIWHKIFGKK